MGKRPGLVRGKLFGDLELLEEIRSLLEETTYGRITQIMKSNEHKDHHFYANIVGVRDE